MNTNVNTNVDFGTSNSNLNTTSSIGNTPNSSSPTYQNTYTQNDNVQTESMDLSFATEQVATESKSIIDSIGDFFSDIEEGLKETGATIVEGAKAAYDWAITGIKDLGSTISEACSNLASNVSSILGSTLSWAKDTYVSLRATEAVIATTIASGIADIGEGIVDGIAWTGGKLAEGGTWLVGKVAGCFSEEAEEAVMELREQVKTEVKDFIATDWVGKANDWFYQETALGKYINENSYLKYDSEEMQKLRSITTIAAEVVAATAVTIATGGAAAPVAFAAVFGLGALEGAGKAAENVYQSNIESTIWDELGILGSGILNGFSWIAQGKLGAGLLDIGKATATQGFSKVISQLSKDILCKDFWKTALKNGLTGMNGIGNVASSAMMTGDDLIPYLTSEKEWSTEAIGELALAFAINLGINVAEDALRGYIIDGPYKKYGSYDSYVQSASQNRAQWDQVCANTNGRAQQVLYGYKGEWVATDGNYKAVNGILRGTLLDPVNRTITVTGTGGYPYTYTFDEFKINFNEDALQFYNRQLKAAEDLSSAISQCKLGEDIQMVRGVNWDTLERLGIDKKDSPATILKKLTDLGGFTENGFMSTCPNTPDLPYIVTSKPIRFILNVKGDTGAVDLSRYNYSEHEVLLQDGLSFIVTSVIKDIDGVIKIFFTQK